MKKEPLIRTYTHKQEANASKLSNISSILKEYQKTAVKVSHIQWRLFFEKNKLNKDFDIKGLETNISERYKQTIQYQVVGQLNSHLSNIQNRFVDVVHKSSITDKDLKIKLFYINKYQKWQHKTVLMQKQEIDQETIHLARKIFKHLNKNKPSFNHANMNLDEKVAVLEKNKKSKEFAYWIKLSTLKKRNTIYIPITKSKYFEDIPGIIKKQVQINTDKEGKVTIGIIKQINQELFDHVTDSLAIDIGLKNLIATQYGELLGVKLYDYLKKYDSITNKLRRNLQKNKIKVGTNKRYNRLNKKVREFLKNEINRILNKLVAKHKPANIIVEDLRFGSSKLNKKTNRILNNFGLGVITKKLDDFQNKNGINILYQNPAYTSQECSGCGHVDKKSRRTRDRFECTSCGLKIHADVNGSRNVERRRSSPITTSWRKEEVFQWLADRNEGNQRKDKERTNRCAKDGERVSSKSKVKVLTSVGRGHENTHV